jgi:hypothetical protein
MATECVHGHLARQCPHCALNEADAKILRYEAALYQIARPDYRGPRSRDQEAAWNALKAEGVVQ